MAIPKTNKLTSEEAVGTASGPNSDNVPFEIAESLGKILIRPVDCQNDFVALLQAQVSSTIALSNDDHTFKNEGLIVGVGPGVNDGNGGRLAPTVEIGDYAMFGSRNVVETLEPSSGPYANRHIVIVSEKNILCRLPTDIEWEIVGVVGEESESMEEA